jgi:very-short-patch-repair endonuclease
MGRENAQAAWDLAGRQQNMVSRPQLLALDYTGDAIDHRIARGRLHPIWPGVYSVGTPRPTRLALWMGAVLAGGDGAALSNSHGGALLGLCRAAGPIHISVPMPKCPRPRGIVVHRRAKFDVTTRHGIPVTTPAWTIADLAPGLTRDELEQMISQADFKGIIKVPALLAAVQDIRTAGAAKVRATIGRRTFTMTRSTLERLFLRIIERAGLPRPLTCVYVNGYEVDFYWPDLRLIVEADGGAAHRTPAQQTADRPRDQAHTASGLRVLRFTHGQIRYEPGYVEEILRQTSSIVRASSPTSRNCV